MEEEKALEIISKLREIISDLEQEYCAGDASNSESIIAPHFNCRQPSREDFKRIHRYLKRISKYAEC